MTPAEALRDFVALFERLGIEYAVMGGMAVRVHAIPRPTYDVDFTIAVERAGLREIFDAVAAMGYTVPEAHRSGWTDLVAGMAVVKVRFFAEGNGVDVDIFLAESRFQKSLLSRRREAEVDGQRFSVVSAEDLILLKLLAARPRDLADIADTLFVQGDLDRAYMRAWANELGVLAELDRALAAA